LQVPFSSENGVPGSDSGKFKTGETAVLMTDAKVPQRLPHVAGTMKRDPRMASILLLFLAGFKLYDGLHMPGLSNITP
jgi:hypothetical protein